jgi:hypothetical protein
MTIFRKFISLLCSELFTENYDYTSWKARLWQECERQIQAQKEENFLRKIENKNLEKTAEIKEVAEIAGTPKTAVSQVASGDARDGNSPGTGIEIDQQQVEVVSESITFTFNKDNLPPPKAPSESNPKSEPEKSDFDKFIEVFKTIVIPVLGFVVTLIGIFCGGKRVASFAPT